MASDGVSGAGFECGKVGDSSPRETRQASSPTKNGEDGSSLVTWNAVNLAPLETLSEF